ncbi:MAG: hypothetical protein H7Y17_06265 [Chlorobia bacterium]|nr:hypothetical protein [Fimbriimonadaceae bacterium]
MGWGLSFAGIAVGQGGSGCGELNNAAVLEKARLEKKHGSGEAGRIAAVSG